MLGDSAPAIPDFGPDTETNAFGSGVYASDAYSWPDGTMIVVRDDTEPPSLELLDRGAFEPVALPALKSTATNYTSIDLGCGSVGEDPIACFLRSDGSPTYFIVKRNGLVPTDASRGKPIDHDWTLVNGDTCTAEGPATATSIAVWTVDKKRHLTPFVTDEALDRASQMAASALVKANQVRCGHVGDVDLLSISNSIDGAVYVVTHGVPTMAGRGAILVSGATHALIFWKNEDRDRNEYTEVFFRKK